MKKIFVMAAALAMVFAGSFAFAESYISANDMDIQQVTGDKTCDDGFVIHASPDKAVKIEKQSGDCPVTVGNTTYTKRISMGGTGKVGIRSISINAKAGQTLTIYAKSSNKGEDRSVGVLNAAGETIGTGTAAVYSKPISKTTVKIPAAGEYHVVSVKNGIYIYEITLN